MADVDDQDIIDRIWATLNRQADAMERHRIWQQAAKRARDLERRRREITDLMMPGR